ncbi:unnamed protein product [Clonostachys chloroleuca]|uniref:Uncharacterized protein n=1 Tax=Clonostachys chloroleuca TaxID=1926264 RepID=A0AA35LYF2_9HYPO|nr:unnamed protein product [Clonostachys chloroleuca]
MELVRPGDSPPFPSPHHCWKPMIGGDDDFNGAGWNPEVDITPTKAEVIKFCQPGFIDPYTERQAKIIKYLNRARVLRRVYVQNSLTTYA